MSDPAITVAVPTFNGARHLRAALRSITQQTVPFDLVLVDDRSDDETVTIARAEVGDRARIEVNSERLGLAGNWNRCVALSQTAQVAIFHQDDVMLSGHLALHVAAYQANPRLGWVASMAEVVDDQGQPVPDSLVERGGLGALDRDFLGDLSRDAPAPDHRGRSSGLPELIVGNPLRCSAVTISRAAHAAVGEFDPSYRYVVDWDYWLRVARAYPVAWRAATTVAIRWHLASETHRFALGTTDLDETARLLRQIALLVDPAIKADLDWPGRANRRLARAYLHRAYQAARAGRTTLMSTALRRALRLAPTAAMWNLARDPRLVGRLGLAFLRPHRTT